MSNKKHVTVLFDEDDESTSVSIEHVSGEQLAYAICILQMKFSEIVRDKQ